MVPEVVSQLLTMIQTKGNNEKAAEEAKEISGRSAAPPPGQAEREQAGGEAVLTKQRAAMATNITFTSGITFTAGMNKATFVKKLAEAMLKDRVSTKVVSWLASKGKDTGICRGRTRETRATAMWEGIHQVE